MLPLPLSLLREDKHSYTPSMTEDTIPLHPTLRDEAAMAADVTAQAVAYIPFAGNPVAMICAGIPAGMSIREGVCGGTGLWYVPFTSRMTFCHHRQIAVSATTVEVTPLHRKGDGHLRAGPRTSLALAQSEDHLTATLAPIAVDPVLEEERRLLATKLWAQDLANRATTLSKRADGLTEQAMTHRQTGLQHRSLGMTLSRQGAALRHRAMEEVRAVSANQDRARAVALSDIQTSVQNTVTRILAREGQRLLEAARFLRQNARRDLDESIRLAHSAAMIAGAALRLRGEANETMQQIEPPSTTNPETKTKPEMLMLPLAELMASNLSQEDGKLRSLVIEGLPLEVTLSDGIEDPIRQCWIVAAVQVPTLRLNVPVATPNFLLTIRTVVVSKGVVVDGERRQLRIVVPQQIRPNSGSTSGR